MKIYDRCSKLKTCPSSKEACGEYLTVGNGLVLLLALLNAMGDGNHNNIIGMAMKNDVIIQCSVLTRKEQTTAL